MNAARTSGVFVFEMRAQIFSENFLAVWRDQGLVRRLAKFMQFAFIGRRSDAGARC
jgi:hypothetical protein